MESAKAIGMFYKKDPLFAINDIIGVIVEKDKNRPDKATVRILRKGIPTDGGVVLHNVPIEDAKNLYDLAAQCFGLAESDGGN